MKRFGPKNVPMTLKRKVVEVSRVSKPTPVERFKNVPITFHRRGHEHNLERFWISLRFVPTTIERFVNPGTVERLHYS